MCTFSRGGSQSSQCQHRWCSPDKLCNECARGGRAPSSCPRPGTSGPRGPPVSSAGTPLPSFFSPLSCATDPRRTGARPPSSPTLPPQPQSFPRPFEEVTGRARPLGQLPSSVGAATSALPRSLGPLWGAGSVGAGGHVTPGVVWPREPDWGGKRSWPNAGMSCFRRLAPAVARAQMGQCPLCPEGLRVNSICSPPHILSATILAPAGL